jgi:hypothetical protein
MKRVLFGLMAAVIFAVVLTGCSSTPSGVPAEGDRPEWVLNPPDGSDDGVFYGMGSAESARESRGLRLSENRARLSVSYQLTALVRGMEIDYQQQAGTDDNEVGLGFFEGVSRQLTDNALSGARVVKRGIGKNGTYYALVSFPESAVRNTITAQINNEASRYAEFKAKEAVSAMDAALAEQRKVSLVESGGE